MACYFEAERMRIFELSDIAAAQAHRPQLERFIYDAIYVVESTADYETLPEVVKGWMDMVANSG